MFNFLKIVSAIAACILMTGCQVSGYVNVGNPEDSTPEFKVLNGTCYITGIGTSKEGSVALIQNGVTASCSGASAINAKFKLEAFESIPRVVSEVCDLKETVLYNNTVICSLKKIDNL